MNLVKRIPEFLETFKDEISTKYEVAKNLKKYDKDVVIFENIKESDMNIISGIGPVPMNLCRVQEHWKSITTSKTHW